MDLAYHLRSDSIGSGVANIAKLLIIRGRLGHNPTTSHYVGKVALLRGNWVILAERYRSSDEQEVEANEPTSH